MITPKVNIYANRLHAIKRYMWTSETCQESLRILGIILHSKQRNTGALMDELEGD